MLAQVQGEGTQHSWGICSDRVMDKSFSTESHQQHRGIYWRWWNYSQIWPTFLHKEVHGDRSSHFHPYVCCHFWDLYNQGYFSTLYFHLTFFFWLSRLSKKVSLWSFAFDSLFHLGIFNISICCRPGLIVIFFMQTVKQIRSKSSRIYKKGRECAFFWLHLII